MEKAASSENIYIDIKLPNGKTQTTKADNLFFDNEFNPETATLPVYVDVANNDNLLISGNYVDIYVRFNVKKRSDFSPSNSIDVRHKW